jgi:hypothetical protein
MVNLSEFTNFFNDISVAGLEDLSQLNLEDISSKLNLLEEMFGKHIKELKAQSVGNITRTRILSSSSDVEFIAKAIVDESSLKTQTEFINHWIANPSEGILGFSGVRIELESYIRIKIQDKMRQNIRIKNGNNNNLDVIFTSKLMTNDVFKMIKDLFPNQKEYDALDMIYEVSSRTIHRAIPIANYLSWGSLRFVLDTLVKKIDNLNPMDTKLDSVITNLKNEGKLLVVPPKLLPVTSATFFSPCIFILTIKW